MQSLGDMDGAPVEGGTGMSKLEKLKLMIGDEDLMSEDGTPSEPDLEQAPDENPEPDISTLSLFSGPEYRDDTIVPVSWGSDSEEEVSSQPPPPALPPRADLASFTYKKTTNTTPETGPPTEVKSVKKTKKISELDGQVGQLSSLSTTFCPILAVAKFPYKYITKEHQERVAQAFFAGGKFWERTWDL